MPQLMILLLPRGDAPDDNGKPVDQRAAKCGACAGAVSRHTAGGLVGRLWQTWRPSGWYANVVWPRKRPTPKCCWEHLNPHPPFHRAVPSGSLTVFPLLGVKSQNPKKREMRYVCMLIHPHQIVAWDGDGLSAQTGTTANKTRKPPCSLEFNTKKNNNPCTR